MWKGNFVLLMLFGIVLASLQVENEILYVDFRADRLPKKFKECLSGRYSESSSGLRLFPNSPITIDVNKLLILYNYTGGAVGLMLQYGEDLSILPTIQIGNYDISFAHTGGSKNGQTFRGTVFNSASGNKESSFQQESERGFVFIRLHIRGTDKGNAVQIENAEGQLGFLVPHTVPPIQIISTQQISLYQFGVASFPYSDNFVQVTCHRSCKSCVGRRTVDCTQCFNDTQLTLITEDTGRCIYPNDEVRGDFFGAVCDWFKEYIGWIILILFFLISAALIFFIWYTCCRPTLEGVDSPKHVPHVELGKFEPD